jgi:hypothetical protein
LSSYIITAKTTLAASPMSRLLYVIFYFVCLCPCACGKLTQKSVFTTVIKLLADKTLTKTFQITFMATPATIRKLSTYLSQNLCCSMLVAGKYNQKFFPQETYYYVIRTTAHEHFLPFPLDKPYKSRATKATADYQGLDEKYNITVFLFIFLPSR